MSALNDDEMPETGTTTTTSKLNQWFPHAVNPIIMSAPMLGSSNATLAAEVTKAGGIGVIPGGFDFSPESPQLKALSDSLVKANEILLYSSLPPPEPESGRYYLPVAVGFILCHRPSLPLFIRNVLPVLLNTDDDSIRHPRCYSPPRAVWLFAPDPEDVDSGLVQQIIFALHGVGIKVFWQVGTVQAAREAALEGADVIVAQGADAGGHQFKGGAGIVSLVPEVIGMLEEMEGKRMFPAKRGRPVVVAAGGIADGNGVAAGMALGAEAVVMGTRFLVATEATVAEARKELLLNTTDGGPSTVKTDFHDKITNPTLWPAPIDGRALKNELYLDHQAGTSTVEEAMARFKEAQEKGDQSRIVVWAGTGVGLLKERQPAGEIVREVREVARERIRRLHAMFWA